jgi:hypothetical protein
MKVTLVKSSSTFKCICIDRVIKILAEELEVMSAYFTKFSQSLALLALSQSSRACVRLTMLISSSVFHKLFGCDFVVLNT